MAGLLRQYTPQYVDQYRRQAAPQVQSTLAKLSLCRTSALGVRLYRCQSCHSETLIYNSCGDRHCSQCAGNKRAEWLEKTQSLLLDGLTYFQVVFTLPSELSRLALGNRKEIYDLLFTASWRALRETVETEQGFQAAAMMVLHTWNQKLEAHGHVHAVVPCGGPALRDPTRWESTTRRGRVNPYYLCDASDLRRAYRTRFIEGLRHIHARGGLKLSGEFEYLQDDGEFEKLLGKLERVSWGLAIGPPPKTDCDPSTMLKYLARYLTGGPISDRRLISHEGGEVKFWARHGKTVGGDRQSVPHRISGVEFVRLWSLHVLPKGYVKTRRFGGWSNHHCSTYLQRCRDLLAATPRDTPPEDAAADEATRQRMCPECSEPMELIAGEDKASWRSVMSSLHRPTWYRESG